MDRKGDCSRLDLTLAIVVSCLIVCGCEQVAPDRSSSAGKTAPSKEAEVSNEGQGGDQLQAAPSHEYLSQRKAMVARQLVERKIANQRVLLAMERVPRHKFVPKGDELLAYIDSPLPIGHRQTISQPYIVALMTELVDPQPTDKALDIGTGSGYQAAVLAETVGSVYSIEIVKPLAEEAKARLASLGYKNVQVRHGDGYQGWPEEAPFDIVIVAAAPDHIPQPLIDQLAPGGTMVIPVGDSFQYLIRIEKDEKGGVTQTRVAPVAFVPMTGEALQ